MSDLLLVDGEYDADVPWAGMVRQQHGALVAGAFPARPPKDWFKPPRFNALTPLTIEGNGRVFGHIAAWHTSHIGMAGGIKPPKSASDYAYFQTGVVETDDGEFVNVGQITLAGGHAPLDVPVHRAVAHYDDTRSAVMDVAAGEDNHGIWVAGALRPDVSPEQLRSIRASSVSGDWRPINGRLEMVAVCAVNCPGFPIPRARVAGGAPLALVAAGVEPLVEAAIQRHADERVEQGIEEGLSMFRQRLLHVEQAVIAQGGVDLGAEAVVVDSDEDDVATQRITELRKRVRKQPVTAAADVEALRARVRRQPVVASVDVEALRARVRRPVTAVVAGGWVENIIKSHWDEALHPRGKDGRFFEKGGVVDGRIFSEDNPAGGLVEGAEVRGFTKSNDGRTWAIVDYTDELGHERQGIGDINSLSKSAAKAKIMRPKPAPLLTPEFIQADKERQARRPKDIDWNDKSPIGKEAALKKLESLHPEYVVDEDDIHFYDYWLKKSGVSDEEFRPEYKKIINEAKARAKALKASAVPVSADVEALRRRVRPFDVEAVTATATSALKTDKREDAVKKGYALPDGSYPIFDKTDWHKAKQAIGRAGSKRAAVIRLLKKRGKALGISDAELSSLDSLGKGDK